MNLTKQILRLLSLFLIILMVTNGAEPCKGPGSPCGSSSDCCGYCRKVGRNPQKKCGSFRGRKWKSQKLQELFVVLDSQAWPSKNLNDLFINCNNITNTYLIISASVVCLKKFYDHLSQISWIKQITKYITYLPTHLLSKHMLIWTRVCFFKRVQCAHHLELIE